MTKTVDRRDVAEVLDRIASFMELQGEQPFRVRAFRSSARAVDSLAKPIQEAIDDGSLARSKGIGPSTMQIVREVVTTGHSSLLEDLREQVPPGLVDMLAISGLGVAKIQMIHERLGVDSLPDLEAAAREGRLAALPRFGKKTAENILEGIASLRRASEYRLLHHATEEARHLTAALDQLPGVLRTQVVGDVRRRMELVQELVIVIVADVPPAEVFRRLADLPGIHELAGTDERVVTLRFAGGSSAQIIVTTPVNAGAVLLEATGSRAHLDQLADHAQSKGFTLHGAALWRGSEFIATPDEATMYRALGLDTIPAELREGRGEIEAAATGALPDLVEIGDLKGLLHCHTTMSDGANTIEELALAARDAGFQYLGVTDHSQSATLAGGLDPELIRRQAEAIDALNARLGGFRILKGIEADILVDGSLDYEPDVLEGLDFVIGSIHSRFTMSREHMTDRLLSAMDNPYLNIIGHPTGQLLMARNPYPLDLDAVFAKAAATGVALEINADPHRLDLDWRLAARAREAGADITIGADAHGVAGLANVRLGIDMARKAWLTAERIANTKSASEFVSWAKRRRPRAGG